MTGRWEVELMREIGNRFDRDLDRPLLKEVTGKVEPVDCRRIIIELAGGACT